MDLATFTAQETIYSVIQKGFNGRAACKSVSTKKPTPTQDEKCVDRIREYTCVKEMGREADGAGTGSRMACRSEPGHRREGGGCPSCAGRHGCWGL